MCNMCRPLMKLYTIPAVSISVRRCCCSTIRGTMATTILPTMFVFAFFESFGDRSQALYSECASPEPSFFELCKKSQVSSSLLPYGNVRLKGNCPAIRTREKSHRGRQGLNCSANPNNEIFRGVRRSFTDTKDPLIELAWRLNHLLEMRIALACFVRFCFYSYRNWTTQEAFHQLFHTKRSIIRVANGHSTVYGKTPRTTFLPLYHLFSNP